MSDIKPWQPIEVTDSGLVVCPECKDGSEQGSANHDAMKSIGMCLSCDEKVKLVVQEGRKDDAPNAVQILNKAVQIMAERGKSYDKSGGEAERSMPKIIAMFNALTGHELTPEQGWKFMCCLKLARSEQGEYREDNYLDGAAYMALAGEEAEASSEAVDD